VLVDTSAAVALVLADHAGHVRTTHALAGRRLGLSGHAAFETFSVLSRLPPPARRRPTAVSRLLAENFPASRYLSAEAAASLLSTLADQGIAGGQVYDALVGVAALEHRTVLATRDRRALDTYRALGVDVEVLDG
jgi:predicted nucleic acid-binding protein